ncbi:MAG TPA: hypothetical protein VFI40_04990 [Nocardioides sp.]|nr:hypothetical protein [Nocardioides sp.]
MAENDDTSTQDGTQDQTDSGTPDSAGAASQSGTNEVSVLRSRYAGQTAKVNELTSEKTALEQQLQTLQSQLSDLQSGKVSAEDAAKALVDAKDQVIAKLEAGIKLADLKGRFPEVYAELGEDMQGLSEAKLAAMEARLQGNAGEGDDAPTPRGNNAARKEGGAAGGEGSKPKTAEDVLAEMRSMALPPEWGGEG